MFLAGSTFLVGVGIADILAGAGALGVGVISQAFVTVGLGDGVGYAGAADAMGTVAAVGGQPVYPLAVAGLAVVAGTALSPRSAEGADGTALITAGGRPVAVLAARAVRISFTVIKTGIGSRGWFRLAGFASGVTAVIAGD